MEEFQLVHDEKIIYQTKPLPGLKKYFFLRDIASFLITFIILGGILIYFIIRLSSISAELSGLFMPILLLGIVAVFILILVVSYVFAGLKYEKRHYWITNKRVIYKQGLIGHSINSIPLERISDITISRSFLENLTGIGSVHIQSMAGQYTRSRYGAEASLSGIPDPERVQKMIQELIVKHRRDERLTM